MPIPLDRDFPFVVWPDYRKDDAPIHTLHVHDCLEIGYCHRGSGIWMVGEKLFTHETGDVTFINHTEVHFAQSATGTDSLWSWILLDPVRLAPGVPIEITDPTALAGGDFANLFSGRRHPDLAATVQRLVAEHRDKRPHWREAVRALVCDLMIQVRRTARATAEVSPRSEYDRLAPALQAMAKDYGEPLRIGALARRCGMSDAHFRRLFLATMGRSPLDYLLNLRLHMAAAMLRTSARSITEVSGAVGFGTLSSFNRLFRRRFAQAPREWRNRPGGKEG